VLANSDPQLRAEVEKLLAQDPEGKILDQPASEVLDATTVTQLAPHNKELVSARLGPYQIEALSGAAAWCIAHGTRACTESWPSRSCRRISSPIRIESDGFFRKLVQSRR
jgi:hypothetical protein